MDAMMASHFTHIAKHSKGFPPNSVWYIEVLAVHPSKQGHGIGRKLLEHIFEISNNAPLYLECTEESNVPFYEKMGFKVVEVIDLNDPKTNIDTIHEWCMMRTAGNLT